MYHLWNIQTVAVGRWCSETCSCYFFELLIFYYFRYFQPKGTFEFFLLLFQIILNQKELFFKKGTNCKVWYIAEVFENKIYKFMCCPFNICISICQQACYMRPCIAYYLWKIAESLWRNMCDGITFGNNFLWYFCDALFQLSIWICAEFLNSCQSM